MSHEYFTPEQLKEQHQQGMMEDLVEGYEKYKKAHPSFARAEEQMRRKREQWPQTVKKVLLKPKVKYKTGKNGIRYKYTLLATIRGQEARAFIESNETGEGHMFSYDMDKMDKVEIYHEEVLFKSKT